MLLNTDIRRCTQCARCAMTEDFLFFCFLFLPFPLIQFQLEHFITSQSRSRNQFNLLRRKIERSGAFSYSLLYIYIIETQQFVWFGFSFFFLLLFCCFPFLRLLRCVDIIVNGWTWLNEWIWHLKIYCFVIVLFWVDQNSLGCRESDALVIISQVEKWLHLMVVRECVLYVFLGVRYDKWWATNVNW